MNCKWYHSQNATKPQGWHVLIVTAFESHRNQSNIFPLPAIVRRLSFLPASERRCLVFPRRHAEACCSSLTLPHQYPPHMVLLRPSCSPLFFLITSVSTNFKLLMRSSKMIHLVYHHSIAWARWSLAQVLTCVPLLLCTQQRWHWLWTRWAWDPNPGSLWKRGQVARPSVNSKHPLPLVLVGSAIATPRGTWPGTQHNK